MPIEIMICDVVAGCIVVDWNNVDMASQLRLQSCPCMYNNKLEGVLVVESKCHTTCFTNVLLAWRIVVV